MKHILAIFFFFLSTHTLWAVVKIPGFFINNNGDTIRAVFTIPLRIGGINYDVIVNSLYYREADNVRKTLKPENAKEVQFVYKNNTIRLISLNLNGITQKQLNKNADLLRFKKNAFLRLMVDGTVQMYYLPNKSISTGGFYSYDSGMTPGMDLKIDRHLLCKNNDWTIITSTFFIINIKKYFSDCPELAITGIKYDFDDLEKIVREYNATCGAK